MPVSRHFDSAGPMAKSSYDLAILLDAMSEMDGSSSFTHSLTASWDDISVATLDPAEWKFPDSFVKPVSEATSQIVRHSALELLMVLTTYMSR